MLGRRLWRGVVGAFVGVLAVTGAASGQCPSPTFAGGGPAATDCFVEWGGVSAGATTCVDGTSCDADGKADGVCTFPLQAFINVAGGSCTSAGLQGAPTVKPAGSAVAQSLATALAALDPSAAACTVPGIAVPVKSSLAGIKAGVAKLAVTATSGGKRDKDKLRLTCQPSTTAPSFAAVQAIMTPRCAYVGCHIAPGAQGNLDLEQASASQLVNVPSVAVPKLLLVKPGNLKGSFMARKVLGGKAIPRPFGGVIMPSGCPNVPPVGGCLLPEELATILYWIKNGAPAS